MRQKQREFEQMMLSGVSNEQREAMWQTAQEKAVSKEKTATYMHVLHYMLQYRNHYMCYMYVHVA